MTMLLIFKLCLITPWLAALSFYDLRYRRLPNVLTLGGCAVGLTFNLGAGGFPMVLDSVLAGGVCGLFLLIPFCMKGAGGGDVKMLAACGIWIGMEGVCILLLLMSLSGFILGVGMGIAGRVSFQRIWHYIRVIADFKYDRVAGRASLLPAHAERLRIPFGLAIAAGCFGALFYSIAVCLQKQNGGLA